MRKLIYFILLIPLWTKGQQTGSGSGTSQPQNIAKILGTGTTAGLTFSFGATHFDVPTIFGTNAQGTWGISITGSAPQLNGQSASYYLNYNNLTNKPTIYSFSGTSSQITNGDGTYRTLSNSDITTALGFTPYNSTNPSGYITSSALTPYILKPSSPATFDYLFYNGSTWQNRPILGSTSTGAIWSASTGTISNDTTVLAPKAYVNNFALKNSPRLTGIPTIQPTNFAGMTTSNFPNSPVGAIIWSGRNLSNVYDEAVEVISGGVGAGGHGGKSWWANNANAGTSGGLTRMMYMDPQNNSMTLDLELVRALTPASSPTGLMYHDATTNKDYTVTWAQAAAGIGTTITAGVQRLASFYTTVSSTTSAADAYSYTLPANTLSSDGQFIDGKIDGSGTGSGTYTIQLSFAGNNFANYSISNSGSTNMQFELYRTSSSTMRCVVHGNYPTGYQYGTIDFTGINFAATNVIKANIVNTGSLVLTLTDAFYRLNP